MRRSLLLLVPILLLLLGPSPGAVIVFSETMLPTMVHFTDPIHTPDRGIAPGEVFDVEKWIENGTDVSIYAYEINLLVCETLDGPCVPSTDADAVSFVEPGEYWVDHNGVIVSPDLWLATLTTSPSESLLFTLGFPVMPDDVLSLHFRMVDTNPEGSYWVLEQSSIPEPGTFVLFAAGLLLCLVRKRN